MKGKGFKQFRRKLKNTTRKIRAASKKIRQNPIVHAVRKAADIGLSSPLNPLSTAYNYADKGFRVANELSKGNFKQAGKEALSMGPINVLPGVTIDSHGIQGSVGKGKTSKRSGSGVRRVAASGSRVRAPSMIRRR